MGILNITPDSFSDGGRHLDLDEALAAAHRMRTQGAAIIDIGGESSRPGAQPISDEEELARVRDVIIHVCRTLPIPISIDTTKAKVAQFAIDNGVEIINDISAGAWDPDLWRTVAQAGAGYVLMHCQGRPENMQRQPYYTDAIGQVTTFLRERLEACAAAGIPPERVVIDPGIGFGKTGIHNWQLIKGLSSFEPLARPVLVGVSRKSFIRDTVGERHLLAGTLVANALAAMRGCSIWRVHDVEEGVAMAKLVSACLSS